MLRMMVALYQVARPWLGIILPEDEHGQDLAEYGLIIALVAIAAVAALGVLSGGIDDVLNSVADTLSGAVGGEGDS